MSIEAKSKIQKILSTLLLVFTIFSLGYMLGKNNTQKQYSVVDKTIKEDHIAVYYLHSTFRCETCNTIERMTKDLLDREYISQMENKTILWFEIDFMQDHDIAKQFEVAASCVVVAKIKAGKVEDYNRLDEVWTYINDPAAFNDYISMAIDSYLKSEGN